MIVPRKRWIARAVLYSLTSISMGLYGTVSLARERSPMVLGTPRPDRALVYFIRTQHAGFGRTTTYLFADTAFLGVIDDQTYGFAYVDPGEHLFWASYPRVTKILELVPGGTYYLDVWADISVLDAARGLDLIGAVGRLKTPSEKETAKAERYVEKRYQRARELEAGKEKAAVEEVAAAPPPDDTAGMVRIPARTVLELELMENVCPATHDVGDGVWFRAADDAAVDGRVYLAKGALARGKVLYLEHGKVGGNRGSIDVAIPSVPARDGTLIPLVAHMAWAGEGREGAATATAVALGPIFGLMVRGKEAYRLAGERIRVTTREDVWVRPRQEATAESPGPTAEATDVEVSGWVRDKVKFAPAKRRTPPDLELYLDARSAPVEVRLQSVGGWTLPEPIAAARISRKKKKRPAWACTFSGRDLIRFMRPGPGGLVAVSVVGRLASGETFSSTIEIPFELSL